MKVPFFHFSKVSELLRRIVVGLGRILEVFSDCARRIVPSEASSEEL